MVVERHMQKGVVREPQDDVAHVLGLVRISSSKTPSTRRWFSSAASADCVAYRVTNRFCMRLPSLDPGYNQACRN